MDDRLCTGMLANRIEFEKKFCAVVRGNIVSNLNSTVLSSSLSFSVGFLFEWFVSDGETVNFVSLLIRLA